MDLINQHEIFINFPDGSRKAFRKGITPLEIAEQISSKLASLIQSAKVNGYPWDLTKAINHNCDLLLSK